MFAYASLYAVAELGPEEQDVFTALGTTNFELVLDYLRIAKVVCEQLHGGGAGVQAQYDSIREKLITAVNNHHAAWDGVAPATRQCIRNALRTHRCVWSTSYDLIPYGAIMSSTPTRCRLC